jgi:hypothetical protein
VLVEEIPLMKTQVLLHSHTATLGEDDTLFCVGADDVVLTLPALSDGRRYGLCDLRGSGLSTHPSVIRPAAGDSLLQNPRLGIIPGSGVAPAGKGLTNSVADDARFVQVWVIGTPQGWLVNDGQDATSGWQLEA